MGSANEVDRLLVKIYILTKPFSEIEFDPFKLSNERHWTSIMNTFWSDVESLETAVKAFVDTSFKNLRSAEGAFEMLMRFKNIKSREAINEQMMSKFGDILTQYEKQVCSIAGI